MLLLEVLQHLSIALKKKLQVLNMTYTDLLLWPSVYHISHTRLF